MSHPIPSQDYDQDRPEPDINAIKERYWDEYLAECAKLGVKPDLSDFFIWYEEKQI